MALFTFTNISYIEKKCIESDMDLEWLSFVIIEVLPTYLALVHSHNLS